MKDSEKKETSETERLDSVEEWKESHRNIQIGYYIKKHRKLNKLTQEELGKRIGRTTSSIQKYESGKTEVPRSVLESIAAALNIHPLYLLDSLGSAEYFDRLEESTISFLNSLGCKIEFNSVTDTVTMHFLEQECIVSAHDAHDLFKDIEHDAGYQLRRFIEKHPNTTV